MSTVPQAAEAPRFRLAVRHAGSGDVQRESIGYTPANALKTLKTIVASYRAAGFTVVYRQSRGEIELRYDPNRQQMTLWLEPIPILISSS